MFALPRTGRAGVGKLVWRGEVPNETTSEGPVVELFPDSLLEANPLTAAAAEDVLRCVFGPTVIGRAKVLLSNVRHVADGYSRRAFSGEVTINPDKHGYTGRYVVLMPKTDVVENYEQRVLVEANVLERLSTARLPFRVPKLAAAFFGKNRPVLVESFISGEPLESKDTDGAPLWSVLGAIAACIHNVDPAPLRAVLPGFQTRREHAQSMVAVLNGLHGLVFDQIRYWIRDNLPPDTPSALLHGDLVLRNLRYCSVMDKEIGVIDWEFAALGDPAYELALMTRGESKPFGRDDGLQRLLRGYMSAGGTKLIAADVRLYELCMVGAMYRRALETHGVGSESEQCRGKLLCLWEKVRAA